MPPEIEGDKKDVIITATGKHIHPVWEHDCDHCRFLGHIVMDTPSWGGEYDLYVCFGENRNFPSILARYSNEPSEYYSDSLGRPTIPPCFVAYMVAVTQKIINDPTIRVS